MITGFFPYPFHYVFRGTIHSFRLADAANFPLLHIQKVVHNALYIMPSERDFCSFRHSRTKCHNQHCSFCQTRPVFALACLGVCNYLIIFYFWNHLSVIWTSKWCSLCISMEITIIILHTHTHISTYVCVCVCKNTHYFVMLSKQMLPEYLWRW